MLRRLAPLAVTGALLAAAPGALAAQVTANRSCYVAGISTMTLTGLGYAPGADVDIAAAGAAGLRLQADGSGAFATTLPTPAGSVLGLTTTERTELSITASDSAGNVGKTSVGVVQFAFKTSSGFKSTRAIRKWSFSGFQDTSRPIYGHFRFGGKTRANYRFGKPTGPCGLLSKRAPGIPARSRAGTWTIQIDQNRAYKPNEKVALKVTSFVSLVPR